MDDRQRRKICTGNAPARSDENSPPPVDSAQNSEHSFRTILRRLMRKLDDDDEKSKKTNKDDDDDDDKEDDDGTKPTDKSSNTDDENDDDDVKYLQVEGKQSRKIKKRTKKRTQPKNKTKEANETKIESTENKNRRRKVKILDRETETIDAGVAFSENSRFLMASSEEDDEYHDVGVSVNQALTQKQSVGSLCSIGCCANSPFVKNHVETMGRIGDSNPGDGAVGDIEAPTTGLVDSAPDWSSMGKMMLGGAALAGVGAIAYKMSQGDGAKDKCQRTPPAPGKFKSKCCANRPQTAPVKSRNY